MDYAESVAWIVGLPRFPRDPSPERVRRYLALAGHPEERFAAVQVAGTNGKGSTAAMLESILRAAGTRVALYTSPHLHRVNERMRVDGEPIPDADFARLATALRARVEREAAADPAAAPGGFDALTAVAFEWFAERGAAVAVVEAGIGGRLDATNVFRAPVVVVTNVHLEHTEVLGATRAAIAAEKSALATAGATLVTAERDPEPLAVIEARAASVGARVVRVGREATATLRDATLDGTTFDYLGPRWRLAGLATPLLGAHQVENAACALAAAEALDARGLVSLPEDVVRAGLSAARWPGRMEVLRREPLVIVDGAHNPHGVRALTASLGPLLADHRVTLVVGVSEGKPREEMLATLLPLADRVVLTRAAHQGVAPELLADAAVALGRRAEDVATFDRVADAVAHALAATPAGGVVLVAGSIFVVAEARDALGGSTA